MFRSKILMKDPLGILKKKKTLVCIQEEKFKRLGKKKSSQEREREA